MRTSLGDKKANAMVDTAEIQLGVTEPTPVDDRDLVIRLIEAFLSSHEDAAYDDESQWLDIRRMHDSIVAVIRSRDVDAVAALLHRPDAGYLFYGFEDIGVWRDEAYADPEHCARYATHCWILLQQLGQALGLINVPNPEAPDRAHQPPPPETLIKEIEHELRLASIGPPAIYPGYHGLATSRGVLGERVINALYCAHRVRQLTAQLPAPRILEIGGGLGRQAHYSYLLGATDYTIVDLPITGLSQGHFLGRALGADRVVLDGEPGIADRSDKIKIMSAERFLAGDLPPYDLVVNIDSFTEIGHSLAAEYFRRAAALAPCLLSVNHEVNDYRVLDLHHQTEAFAHCDRQRYWLRDGYVEEIYRTGPGRGGSPPQTGG